jgi:hypothetical protein
LNRLVITQRSYFSALSFALIVAASVSQFANAPAQAAATAWFDHDEAKARLIAERDSAGSSETIQLGLQFRLQPGWKIYWHSPGDAGYPPRLDWLASDNLADIETRWPVPHRFSILGLESFGYKNEIVLPMVAQLERPGEELRLRARLTYLARFGCYDTPFNAVYGPTMPDGQVLPEVLTEDAVLEALDSAARQTGKLSSQERTMSHPHAEQSNKIGRSDVAPTSPTIVISPAGHARRTGKCYY